MTLRAGSNPASRTSFILAFQKCARNYFAEGVPKELVYLKTLN